MSLIQDLLWAGAGGVVGNKMTEAVNHTIKTASTPPGEEPPPSDNDIRRAIVDMARRLDALARALSKESLPDVDTSIQIPVYPGAVTIPHFRPRRAHNMIFLPTPGLTLLLEIPSVGRITIENLAQGWNTLDLPEGVRVSIPSGGASVSALYRASDNTATALSLNSSDTTPTGQVSGSGPGGATATTGGQDFTYTFAQQVNKWEIQNNTAANVNVNTDAAASPGTLLLVPGAILREDEPVNALHVYTAANQNVNGAVAGNIVIRGWL